MVHQAVRNEAGPAHGHTTSSRRKSPVWKDFDYVNVPGGTAMGKCRRCGSMFQASSKGHGTSAMLRHAKSPCCAKRAAKRAAHRAGPCLQAAAPAAADDNDDEDEQAPFLPAAAAPAAADDNDDEDEQAPCLPAAPAPDDDLEWRAMVKSIDDLHKHPGYDPFLFSREEQQDGGLTTTSSPSADLATADLPFTKGDHHRCSPNHGMPDMPQAHSSSSMRFFRKKRERRSANSASRQGETTDKGHSSLINTGWAPTVDDSTVYTDFNFGDAYDFDS